VRARGRSGVDGQVRSDGGAHAAAGHRRRLVGDLCREAVDVVGVRGDRGWPDRIGDRASVVGVRPAVLGGATGLRPGDFGREDPHAADQTVQLGAHGRCRVARRTASRTRDDEG
jgi:hypothetical protein